MSTKNNPKKQPLKKLSLKVYSKYTLLDVLNNPNSVFIFGDNDIKRGKKGQSIIRDLENAIGIPTKKIPSYDPKAYYLDKDLDEIKVKIDLAIDNLKKSIREHRYTSISLPKDGIGTGLARLPTKAPLVNSYLRESLDNFFKKFIKSKDYLEYQKLENYQYQQQQQQQQQ